MPERFEKKFKCIDDSCDGQGNIPHQISEDEWEAQQCQFHAEYLFPLKKLIQSEIDLAVAKKEKEIVERIEKISIPRDMYYKKIIDKIINIITTK